MAQKTTARQVGGYEFISRLDQNTGTTMVYEARNLETGQRVAIKVIPFDDEAALEEPMREVQLLAQVQHKNIVDLKHAFKHDGKLHIVMTFVEGSNLAKLKASFSVANQRDIVEVGIQVCQALEYLHRHNIHHCDVKPSNILIADPFWHSDYDRDQAVKLTDLGISQLGSEQDMAALRNDRTSEALLPEQSTSMRGSPAYMAPERFRGEPLIPQSDIWSVGVILYELLAGKKPFEGRDYFEYKRLATSGRYPPLSSTIPFALRDVIQRCLQLDPEDRFATATELKEHLRRINTPVRDETYKHRPGTEPAQDAEPVPSFAPEPDKPETHRWPLWLRLTLDAIGFLLLAGIIAAFYYLFLR